MRRRALCDSMAYIVELAGGELRIVGEIDALVPELATNLIHPLKASNNQHLQVEFRGDSHKELHVEVIVVRYKGPGCGTPRNHVHHGSLNLHT